MKRKLCSNEVLNRYIGFRVTAHNHVNAVLLAARDRHEVVLVASTPTVFKRETQVSERVVAIPVDETNLIRSTARHYAVAIQY
jgi:hypothetical protein